MIRRLTAIVLIAVTTACSASETADEQAVAVARPAAIAQRVVAEHADVSVGDVRILSSEAVDFSDSSLDCPKPDMAYLQVITPGHKVRARVGERDYDVRVAGQQGFVCEPKPEQPPKRDSSPAR
jgi:hypothetical protein